MASRPFLVVSYCIPNRASGTPVVIRKFLQNFKSDEVILIGRPTLKSQRVNGTKLDYPTLIIPTPPVEFRGEKVWRFLSVPLGVIIGLIAYFIYMPKAILSFYRDESSLLTGYLLHKITRAPLFSYFCDVYLENYPKGIYRTLAQWLQPRVFMESRKVIVLTEAMKDYYKSKYNIEAQVLPHCNNTRVPVSDHENGKEGYCRIGYLGAINIDRIQSLLILCQAIIDKPHYQLTYFTTTSKEFIQQQNLNINNSVIKFISDEEQLLQELSSSDILFLPLAIPQGRGEREVQVATGFPTKLIDYLLCKVPILVHGEKDSYGARFIKDHQCGYLVSGGSKDLFSAIVKVESDLELRKHLISNSVASLQYFDGSSISNSFRKLICQEMER